MAAVVSATPSITPKINALEPSTVIKYGDKRIDHFTGCICEQAYDTKCNHIASYFISLTKVLLTFVCFKYYPILPL